jgi:hypothetical protein
MSSLEGHVEGGELAAFVYGELEPQRRAVVAEHLEACADCRGEAERWQAVRGELRRWEIPQGRVWRGGVWRGAGRVAAAVALVAAGFAGARLSGPRAVGAGDVQGVVASALAQRDARDAARQEVFEAAVAESLRDIEARRLADNATLRQDMETVAMRTQAAFQQLQVANGPGM